MDLTKTLKMTREKAINIRLKQRKQYLENPNFERLSDILTQEYDYRQKRDNYLFLYLLCGSNGKIKITDSYVDTLETAFLEKYKRSGINLNGIYQYYQERKKSIDNGEGNEQDNYDIKDVIRVLEKHKDKIIKPYVTF